VPLLVSLPGKDRGETITNPVSTLDIVPTILQYADASREGLPEDPLVDESGRRIPDEDDAVFAIATGEGEDEAIRRFAVRDNRWKAVLECDITSGEVIDKRVYDLQNDPTESDILGTDDNDVQKIMQLLREFITSRLDSVEAEQRDENKDTVAQTSEINKRLEALGYK
jgi:arylsulfatase A-like enzyme